MVVVVLLFLPTLRSLPTIPDGIRLALSGAFATGFATLLLARATKVLRALDINLILVLESILAPIWAYLALKEIPGPTALWGAIIIFSSVIAHTIIRSKQVS